MSSLIELKYLHLPSNLVINIFTLTDYVLLEKYIFYMHYSVYCKLLAARIFVELEHDRKRAAILDFNSSRPWERVL